MYPKAPEDAGRGQQVHSEAVRRLFHWAILWPRLPVLHGAFPGAYMAKGDMAQLMGHCKAQPWRWCVSVI